MTMSWPSAKTSASTVTVSPGVRLIGNRPPSTSGATDSMMMRRCSAGSSDGLTPVGRLSGAVEGRRRRFAIEQVAEKHPIRGRPVVPNRLRAAHRRAGCPASARPSIGPQLVALAGAQPAWSLPRIRRVDQRFPALDRRRRGQHERDRGVVGVEQDAAACRRRCARRARRLRRSRRRSAARRARARRASSTLSSVISRAGRVEPRDVLHVRAADPPPLEELAAPQHRVLLPEPNQPARELEELALLAASDPSRAS